MLVKSTDFSTRQTFIQILALLPPFLVTLSKPVFGFLICKMGMTNLTALC